MVPNLDRDERGRPHILYLSDLTGEGLAAQFVLSEYIACGIASTAVLGYSGRRDAAMQYRIESWQAGRREVHWSVWHAFLHKPVRPGYWKFRWTAGHGMEVWLNQEITFDWRRQVFVQRIRTSPLTVPKPNDNRHRERR